VKIGAVDNTSLAEIVIKIKNKYETKAKHKPAWQSAGGVRVAASR